MTLHCRRLYYAFALLITINLPASVNGLAAEPDYDALAKRIVNTSASIKPGEVVVISAGKHVMPLAEAVAIEAQKAGGLVTIFLNTDRLARSRWVDVPEKFLEQEPRYLAEWVKQIDVWIGLPGVEDEAAVTEGVPEARIAKGERFSQYLVDALNSSKIRVVGVGFPTRQEAELNGLDFDTYQRMHWAAVNADYAKIAEQGSRLKQLLAGAKSIRITSPSGTDFTVSLGDRPILVWDGVVTSEDAQNRVFLSRMATLPDGTVTFAPIEDSANGRVVIPKHQIRQEPLTDVQFSFKNGKIEDFHAAQGGKRYEETMAAYQGPKDVVGSIAIGLNPELKIVEVGGAGFRPIDGAGMVWIHTGNNELSGGKNDATGGFDFPITNATVTVDGKVVVKDGKLEF